MTSEQAVNAPGTIQIGSLIFAVQELSIEGEIGLRAKLRALTRESFGPGSFYANVLPVAKWAREQGQHQDAAALVASIAPLVATKTGASDDATEVYRQGPEGVAWELFFRTRKTHPESTREEIRAVINEANCLEVHLAMLEAIAPKAPTHSDLPSG
jgi:hypothetical protein